MISTALLRQTVVIERSASGSDDERGIPAQTWATLASVPGSIQPVTARDLQQLSGGGPVATTHKAYLDPTDVTAADRLVADGVTYAIDGVLDEAGRDHHLKLFLHAVT